MARNVIVINVDLRETRVALIENGVIAELQIERAAHRGTVGNIVLGRVTRVLPGMQAAFIDVGQERAAFLHVEDLIRPADFDAYLSADAREEEGSFPDEAEATTKPSEAASQPAPRRRRSRSGPAQREVPGDEPAGDDVVLTEGEAVVDGETVVDGEAVADADAAEPVDAPEVLDDEALEDDDELETDDDEEGHGDLSLQSSAVARLDRDAAELYDESDIEYDDHDEDASPDSDDEGEDALPGDDLDEDDDEDDLDEDDDENGDDSEDALPDEDDLDEGDDENGDDEDPELDDALLEELDSDLDSEDLDSEDEQDIPKATSSDTSDEDELDSLDEDEDEDDEALVEDGEDDDLDDEVLDENTEDGEHPSEDTDPNVQLPDLAASSEQPRTSESRRRRARRARGKATSSTAPNPEAGEVESAPEAAPAEGEEAGSRRGRRRRRRGRGGRPEPLTEVKAVEAVEIGATAQRTARANNNRRRRGGKRRRGEAGGGTEQQPRAAKNAKLTPIRVSRSVPITEVVKEGNQVVVQISKEPIGTKGARVTSHVSLAGRYVVYLPTVEHVGISKRIGNARERSRLRKTIDALKPPTGGLIVRTVAEGLTKKQLKADVGYLIKVWSEVGKRKREAKKAPAVLYDELDLVLKAARDMFTDEIDHIVIDDRDQYGRLARFVEMFMPGRVKDIKLYTGDEPVFDAYGIEDEIKRALGRKVPLPSGGSLIVDQAEALTAIDVNTGRYVGKGSKDLEETALKTNLEAVDEIAYQLRFRNIGGLVILDLIDMERAENRDKVWRVLEHKLAKDKAKTTINRISELGLIEMTRKRTRESLGRIMHEPCFYCDGTGHIQSRETVAYEILRQIRRDRQNLPGYSVRIHAHPAVIDFLKFEAKDAVVEAERRYMRRLELIPHQEYHLEQYDLQGR